jgi:hypothetical protein
LGLSSGLRGGGRSSDDRLALVLHRLLEGRLRHLGEAASLVRQVLADTGFGQRRGFFNNPRRAPLSARLTRTFSQPDRRLLLLDHLAKPADRLHADFSGIGFAITVVGLAGIGGHGDCNVVDVLDLLD